MKSLKFSSQVPVQFEFIKKLNESAYCKPWLSAEPSKAVINVGTYKEIFYHPTQYQLILFLILWVSLRLLERQLKVILKVAVSTLDVAVRHCRMERDSSQNHFPGESVLLWRSVTLGLKIVYLAFMPIALSPLVSSLHFQQFSFPPAKQSGHSYF